jgi:hypothetical protein
MGMSVSVSKSASLVGLIINTNAPTTEVAYINIVEGWFNGPRLMTSKGRMIWTGKPRPKNIKRFVA